MDRNSQLIYQTCSRFEQNAAIALRTARHSLLMTIARWKVAFDFFGPKVNRPAQVTDRRDLSLGQSKDPSGMVRCFYRPMTPIGQEAMESFGPWRENPRVQERSTRKAEGQSHQKRHVDMGSVGWYRTHRRPWVLGTFLRVGLINTCLFYADKDTGPRNLQGFETGNMTLTIEPVG